MQVWFHGRLDIPPGINGYLLHLLLRIFNATLALGRDPKGRVVPDACNMLTFRLQGEGRILGVGNGDPSYLGEDHPKDSDCHEFQIPAFNGLAQVLIQSSQKPSVLTLTASSERLKAAAVTIQTE